MKNKYIVKVGAISTTVCCLPPMQLYRSSVRSTKKPIKEYTRKSQLNLFRMITNACCTWVNSLVVTFDIRAQVKDGKRVKRIINSMITRLKRHIPDLQYVWKLEFNSYGSPHLHFIFSHEVAHLMKPMVDQTPEGYSCHSRVLDPSAADYKKEIRILANYLAKADQTTPPAGYMNLGRYWGCSRDLRKEFELGSFEVTEKEAIELAPELKSTVDRVHTGPL